MDIPVRHQEAKLRGEAANTDEADKNVHPPYSRRRQPSRIPHIPEVIPFLTRNLDGDIRTHLFGNARLFDASEAVEAGIIHEAKQARLPESGETSHWWNG